MREIKFRAWDKINKRFMYVTIHPTHISWSSPYWLAQGLLRGEDENVEGIGFSGIEGWQQFTGLKDKNGVEIYEGDIVKWWRTEEPHVIHAVEWFDKDACFGAGGLPFEVIFQSGFYQPEYGKSNLEIIGNVHEHPDLLNRHC